MNSLLRPAFIGRHDFGHYLHHCGLYGSGVEVGTHRGDFAYRLISGWQGHLTCVDPYLSGYDEGDPASYGDRDKDFEQAQKKLAPFRDRVLFLRLTSENAAPEFTDGSLDFVYVDAKHRFNDVLEDLMLWYPKLKTGGVLAGHDILTSEPDGGWGKEIQPAALHFAREQKLDLYLVPEENGMPWSYFFHKDNAKTP